MVATAGINATTRFKQIGYASDKVSNGIEQLGAAGAVDPYKGVTLFDLVGIGTAYTLADGEEGAIKEMSAISETGGTDTAVITPANLANGTTITLDDPLDSVRLLFFGGAWNVIGNTGAVVA